MQLFVEYALQGLALGAVYGLIALPLSLIWSSTGHLDIALGGYAVVAGVLGAKVGGPGGVVAGIAVGIALGLVSAAFFVALEWRGMRDALAVILGGFALLFATESFVLWRWGPNPVHVDSMSGSWQLADVPVPKTSMVNLVAAGAIVALLMAVLSFTPLGRSLRASAISARGAALVGIPVRWLQVAVFAAAGGLAGFAGLLLVSSRGLSFDRGVSLTLAGFGALIIFGVRTPALAVLGGLALGLVDSLSAGYASPFVARVVPLVFVLAVLASGRFDFSIDGERP